MGQDFHFKMPTGPRVPILVSVPHSGVVFPEDLKAKYHPEIVSAPLDTDWFVHELYSFASNLGVTMIFAEYSRYVIDLNRSPENKALYGDGRLEMGLVPTTTAEGKPLYVSEDFSLASQSREEQERRLNKFYRPYHAKVRETLEGMRTEFGHALLFEAHSIRPYIPAISPTPFPDLILGDQNGTTAAPSLSSSVVKNIASSQYRFSHNSPFRGGFLTRHFGKPEEKIHALQLEMSQNVYLSPDSSAGKVPEIEPVRAATIRVLLRAIFADLIAELEAL